MLRKGPRRAGEIATDLGLPAPTMSRHLRALREADLVEETHPAFDTRVRIYALKPAALSELSAWLAETEALWSDQLAAFKAQVERD